MTALAWTANAEATPSAKLVYVKGAGAATCPDEGDLRRAVATRIGYDPFFPTATKTVVAQVSRGDRGFRGRVQIVADDGNVRGEKDLATSGDDCVELVSAMALAVSIALDDLEEVAPPPPPAEPAAEEPPAPEMDLTTKTAATSPTPRQRDEPTAAPPTPRASASKTVSLGVSVGPSISIGTAPTAAAGASLAGTLGYGLFAARLGLQIELPAGADLSRGGRLSTSSLLATGSGCLRTDVPFVCVGGGLGNFSSTTEGLARPASDSGVLVVLVATVGARVALSQRINLEPFVQTTFAATRPRVIIDGVEWYRRPIVGGTAGLQLGYRFL